MTRIGVIGAGLIGKRHIAAIAALPQVTLAGVVEPAGGKDLPLVSDLEALCACSDGIVIATPNHLHAAQAIAVLDAGVPVLVEKPLAATPEEGARIVAASRRTGVPVLVGHHRRHNPLIRKAREIIAEGALGTLTTLHANCWLPKPDSYFDAAWRQGAGAGPLFINLIHDVDLMMHLCGPITQVQAMQSDAVRGAAVEDTVVVAVRFASGQLGTLNLSDAALGPWSWELTSGENPAYPKTSESCYLIGGTRGALSLPDLTVWQQAGGPDWWKPISATRQPCDTADPLQAQILHFAEVIASRAEPLVSAADGLRALEVIAAIKTAATTGQAVTLSR